MKSGSSISRFGPALVTTEVVWNPRESPWRWQREMRRQRNGIMPPPLPSIPPSDGGGRFIRFWLTLIISGDTGNTLLQNPSATRAQQQDTSKRYPSASSLLCNVCSSNCRCEIDSNPEKEGKRERERERRGECKAPRLKAASSSKLLGNLSSHWGGHLCACILHHTQIIFCSFLYFQ